MLNFKYIIYGLVFYFNFSYACYDEVTINNNKHVINQTVYDEIKTIYGYTPKIRSHGGKSLYFTCYINGDAKVGADGDSTFFVFDQKKEDTLIAVASSSLSLRNTEENMCSFIDKNLVFKINHHLLGESNPTPTDKINDQKENLLVKKSNCSIKEKLNYFKNNLIKYEVYLSEDD